MKKLFAVFFSLSLLMGVMTPMSVSAEEEADPAGTLFFEFEDLAEAAGAGNIQTEANHRDALSVENASGKAYWATIDTTTDPSATLTVNVTAEQAGYYKCQYAVMKQTDTTNLSTISLSVNDAFVGDNEKNCTELADLTGYELVVDGNGDPVLNEDGTQKKKQVYPWQYAKMSLFEGANACYLQEGANTLQVDVSYAEKAQYGKWKFFADYIKFVPTKGTIIASEGTVIEAENMTSQFPVEITGASGGKWIGKDAVTVAGEEATTELKPIQTLVTFPESRYYDLSFVTTKWSSSVSEISLHLGGNKIGGNKEDQQIGVNVQDRFTGTEGAANWTKQWCNMMEYSKSVWIEAGTYPLEIQIACCEHQDYTTVVKYFMDYVSFKPTADSVEKDDLNNYTAKVYFGASVSGTAMIALYNGQEFLGVSSKSVSEAQYVETSSVQTDKTVTKVKVFVWDGFENCIPQIVCKEIIVSE